MDATLKKPAVEPDSTIVTARVPKEIKRQGNEVLKSIGSTPTQLINAAYEYVLKHGALPPSTPSFAELAEKRRTLTPEQKQKLQQRIERTTFAVPDSFWQEKSDEELIAEAVREKYESLA